METSFEIGTAAFACEFKSYYVVWKPSSEKTPKISIFRV